MILSKISIIRTVVYSEPEKMTRVHCAVLPVYDADGGLPGKLLWRAGNLTKTRLMIIMISNGREDGRKNMDTTIQVRFRSFSDTEERILRMTERHPGEIVQVEDVLYFRNGDGIYSCTDTPEGRKLLEPHCTVVSRAAEKDTEEKVWRDILAGNTDPPVMKTYRITDCAPRCLVLFRPVQDTRYMIQKEMIPTEESDRIIDLENGETALILDMKKRSGNEAYEYAAAAAETLESENGISCYAGIGRTAARAADLSASLTEARKAIDTGIRHRLPGQVFVYEQLTLERLTDLIPEESAEAFRKDLIPARAEKVLNSETLETVLAFFQNDLNVSTTARQLFIHRNTLLYRMEKIRKATGLDLRKFDDAVVFRMMYSDRKPDQKIYVMKEGHQK